MKVTKNVFEYGKKIIHANYTKKELREMKKQHEQLIKQYQEKENNQ